MFKTGYNVEKTIYSQRGVTHTITKTDVSNNNGYSFYGFGVLTDQQISQAVIIAQQDSLTISIDESKPESYHVYMLYKKVQYTVKLVDFNKISLTYRSTPYYPLNKVTMSFDRFGTSYSQAITSQLTQAESAVFDNYTITVSDTNLKVKPSVNLGFSVKQFKFVVNGVESEAFDLVDGAIELNLTPEFISEYVYDNYITIKFVEDYEYYTITYYTLAVQDSELHDTVFMAAIDATTLDEDAQIDTTETSGQRTITISHLKRYSSVTLKSQGEHQGGDISKSYNFVRFVTDDASIVFDPDSATAELTKANLTLTLDSNISVVDGHININVIYCIPAVNIRIQTVRPEICDLVACSQNPLNKLYIKQGGETLTPNVDENLCWKIDLSEEKVWTKNESYFLYSSFGVFCNKARKKWSD